MRWFDTVQAPSKRFVWFGNSAHYTQDRGRVLIHLVRDARSPAVAVGDAAP